MSGQGFFAVVQVLMSSVPAVIYVVAGWLIVGGDVGITAGAIVARIAPMLGVSPREIVPTADEMLRDSGRQVAGR